jgi:catechol 2,3-dioxygenase-like lactoylglutathione lyase family enzyme
MAALQACPFCRKLFTAGEASQCPDCEVALVGMNQLPPSLDALEDEAEQGQITLPEDQPLPPTYLGRGRGALIAVSIAGIVAFFLPWVELTAPEADRLNLDHFCFRVEPFDEEAIVAHLKRHNVAVGPVRQRYGAEGNGASIYLTDPEGNTVELKGPSDGRPPPPPK